MNYKVIDSLKILKHRCYKHLQSSTSINRFVRRKNEPKPSEHATLHGTDLYNKQYTLFTTIIAQHNRKNVEVFAVVRT